MTISRKTYRQLEDTDWRDPETLEALRNVFGISRTRFYKYVRLFASAVDGKRKEPGFCYAFGTAIEPIGSRVTELLDQAITDADLPSFIDLATTYGAEICTMEYEEDIPPQDQAFVFEKAVAAVGDMARRLAEEGKPAGKDFLDTVARLAEAFPYSMTI